MSVVDILKITSATYQSRLKQALHPNYNPPKLTQISFWIHSGH